MRNKKLVYIGLNGYAGAGKDTVAKMLKTILGRKWNSLEECKEYYNQIYTNPTWTATFHSINLDEENNKVLCIAYADQLKMICSNIFGIPFERFYMNKSTAWVCINKDFQYTEIKPTSSNIITADEYYYGYDNYIHNNDAYWMSLREVLVYVGTYVLQKHINKKIFVNIVNNKIHELEQQNPNLEYIIITDNRFTHELDYIRNNNGITISIVRNSIEQLDNIAEHELDNIEPYYDYVIDNSHGYDELFENVWNLVVNNVYFQNITTNLFTRENIDNYLRLISVNKEKNEFVWILCTKHNLQKIYKEGDIIKLIDLTGGPVICIDEDLNTSKYNLHINQINYFEFDNYYYFTIHSNINYINEN